MSLALARKYRPSTFDDLIGQETVSQTLSLALDGDRLSHAYLFSGLRGSGKTSTARIFAKALLCEKGATSHPCGVCGHCVMANESRHMDIIEMDAASNRGIDDIKDLIEHTKYKPSSARYKIFIIDEVHMLTNQAFNALLKTLEEPPSFVKFILATTDPLKLPATILSRTQHFRFKKIPQTLVLRHLEHILDLENVGYEIEALDILARSGAGSLRDSLTLTDQAIVYSKNFVDVNTVTSMLGIIEPSHLENLLLSIMNKDQQALLDFIILAKEYEAEMILDELTLYLKELLLQNHADFTPMIIERFFRVIAESKQLLALGSDGEFVLSLALFKMMESLEIKDIDSMIRGLEQELQGVEVTEVKIAQTPISLPKIEKPPLVKMKTTALKSDEAKAIVSDAKPIMIEVIEDKKEIIIPIIPKAPAIDPSIKIFETLIAKIYDRNYKLGECFERNVFFQSFKENTLTWESTAKYADKKLLITYWGFISVFVKEQFGLDTKIKNIPKEKAPQKEEISDVMALASQNRETKIEVAPQQAIPITAVDESQMKSSCIAPEAGETESAKEKDPSTLLNEPMVKEALALFDPRKVRIKRNV